MKNCIHCGAEFSTRTDRRKKFCSRSCAATFNNTGRRHSSQTKQKLSKAAKANPTRRTKSTVPSRQRLAYDRTPKLCTVCKQPVPYGSRQRKSCSDECLSKIAGGYRRRSGYSKHGWYRGVWCDSLYELAFVIYQMDQGRTIQRCGLVVPYADETGKMRKYHPDFEVEGVMYEIKGWLTERSVRKAAAAPAGLIMLVADENKPFIEYACNKYGTYYERLVEVYDSTPHMHDFICQGCGKPFKHRTKDAKACSQVCSGKVLARLKQARRMVAPTGAAPVFPV